MTQQPLTYAHVYDAIKHVLAQEEGIHELLSWRRVIDEAGFFFCRMHPWKWLETGRSFLGVNGKITGTGKDWTQATKTLTDTGAFADYVWHEGDGVKVTAGTGLTLGRSLVASRTSDDAIVLEKDLGGDTVGTVSYTLNRDHVDLPSDVQEIIEIAASDSLVNGMLLTAYADLLRKQTSQVEVDSSWTYYGAVVHGKVTSPTTGDFLPFLRIWPIPNNTTIDTFSLFYRKDWVPGSSDDSELPIPEWLQGFFIHVARQWAAAYEEGDVMERADRLRREILGSPEFQQAISADGRIQPTYGPLRGAAVERTSNRGFNVYLATTVAAPS